MSDTPPFHTDITAGDWIDRLLLPWARPYARLMRLDRPIGTWLLLLPCWWGVALAGGAIPAIWFFILFAIGAVVMRGAGCVINDIYDRSFDRQVERTRMRPLASNEIKLWQALVFLTVLLLLGLGVLVQFDRFTIWLGISSLLLVFTYPLAKRITWWPQLVLGLAFNWGALMGWSAMHGAVGWPSLWLYAAGIFWTLGYDTIYAHQDKRDDQLIGIKSLALKLGEKSKIWVAGFYGATLLCLLISGFVANSGLGFYIFLCGAMAHVIWQVSSWILDDPANCLRRFQSNRDFGLIVLAAIMIGKLF